MVLFESLSTVFYLHCIATVAVSLAVSTQYTNATDTQPGTARQQEPRYTVSLGCSRAEKKFMKIHPQLFDRPRQPRRQNYYPLLCEGENTLQF